MADEPAVTLRAIRPEDNQSIAQLIKDIMPEFGADGPGFAIHDTEVNDMYGAYSQPGALYMVYEKQSRIIGGAGIGPLVGGDPSICELKKMYFYKEARGLGLGSDLLRRLLSEAQNMGYTHCYLETLDRMEGANRLYSRSGFVKVERPLGNTGHFGCDRWLIKTL